MKTFLIILLVFFAFTASAIQPGKPLLLLARSHEEIVEPGLSSSEWRWVREHRKIRLAVWQPMMPPYDITTGLNDYGGINADFIGLMAENLGVDIEIVRYATYSDALAALRKGEVDFIPQAGNNQKKQGLVLSVPYSKNIAVEVINTEDPSDKMVKKIAISPVYDSKSVLERYPGAELVTFSSSRHALEALAFHKIDLFFSDATTARYLASQSHFNNLYFRPVESTLYASGFSYAAMPKMQVWITILNKMLAGLPQKASVEIHRRWSGGLPLSFSKQPLVYTSLERKWISDHPRLRVAVAQNNEPISCFDEHGQLNCILANLLTALSLRTGFIFDIQRYPDQASAFRAVSQGDADVIAGATQEDIWQANLLTTQTWFINSWVMVGRAQTTDEMLKPRLVSLRSEAPEHWLSQLNEGNKTQVDTWQQGLSSIVQQKNDMMVMPLINANEQLKYKMFSSLKILNSIDTDPLRFAFGTSRQVWPLVTILNKALDNIPPEDLHAMTREGVVGNLWSSVSAPVVTKKLNAILIITVGIILAFVLWWGCRLRRNKRERTREIIKKLRNASHRANRASRGKSAFLSTMSHEIRTPVGAIIGMLELVMKRPCDLPQNRQSLQIALEASQSLLLLIGNVLDVERIESGRLILRPERASLRRLIEKSTLLFEELAVHKSLKFVLEIDSELKGDVLIDVMRFQQIVTNLLGNAIKFTERGQVILSAQQQWKDSEFTLLVLEVKDTGEGIDETTCKRLFRPFTQGENCNVGQGSGLGLYICRQLADMMGGGVSLQSVPGEGTTVTVTLKLPVLSALAPSETSHLTMDQTRPTLNIMIVDDNPAGRMLLTQQLEWLGHRVISYDNPQRLFDALDVIQPDAVISDCNMPGMNGYALAREMHIRYPIIPVFGITADARESAREAARDAGMRACIFKPITLAVLEELLISLSSGDSASGTDWPSATLPAALLEEEHLNTFLALQLTVVDETLTVIRQWQDDPHVDLNEALHRFRGGIQLLGEQELEALCIEQEKAADVDGVRLLQERICMLREMLIHWRNGTTSIVGKPTKQ